MLETPKGLRRHIVILGRRNAGKSTFANALSRQQVSIVSPEAGTTTDPVEKTMELAPLGPVVLVDTAGIDDMGELGAMRVARSYDLLARADLAAIITDGDQWGEPEKELAVELAKRNVPYFVARNKADNGLADLAAWRGRAKIAPGIPIVDISAKSGAGFEKVVAALASLAGADDSQRPLLSDLVPENGVIVLVVPIDTGAPKGRLILPQVQAIRDCLDGGKICVVANDRDYPLALKKLVAPPDLVICDSQVVHSVAANTPPEIPLTTFSILLARFKGDLIRFAKGAAALENLKPGDVALIQEACSHHAQKDDIGRVKIPRLLKKLCGGDLDIRHTQGKELVSYDPDIKVVIHCGACVITRKQMLARQESAGAIPMTNYGVTISLCQGILPRALALFPEALAAYEREKSKKARN